LGSAQRDFHLWTAKMIFCSRDPRENRPLCGNELIKRRGAFHFDLVYVCVQPSLAIFVCLGHQVFCLSLTFGTARAIPAQTHILLIRLWYDIALVGVCVYAFCARPSKLLSLLAALSLSWFMTQN
jgi:hypothetical protein